MHRPLFKQQRVYERVVKLVLGELFSFGRHTVTQLVLALGLGGQDWRLVPAVQRGALSGRACQRGVGAGEPGACAEEVYVVAGDGTQTPRSAASWKGGWLRCLRTPPSGWGSTWPSAGSMAAGCCRKRKLQPGGAYPLAARLHGEVCAGGARTVQGMGAARDFLVWLKAQLRAAGRAGQALLMVADGGFDTLELWSSCLRRHLAGAQAKNRVLYSLPGLQVGGRRASMARGR